MSGGETLVLRTGARIPCVLLGTWKSPADKTTLAVKTALECGYRGVDCGNDYGNEPEVGRGIAEFLQENPQVKRQDLFIQAKLWNSNHRPGHVASDLEATLSELGLEYVDLFLMHFPMAAPAVPGGDPQGKTRLRATGCYPDHHSKGTLFPLADDDFYCSDDSHHFVETWHEMEKLVDQGKAKAIGLSNFNMKQVKEVMTSAKNHLPAVLQNESHPYLHQRDLRDFCRINNIVFQAFSSLGSFDRPWRQKGSITSGPPEGGYEVLDDPVIRKIAERMGKTPAQVVLRIWDFSLTEEDMSAFCDLNVGWRHLLFAETSLHPDYPFRDWLPSGYRAQRPEKWGQPK